MKGYKGFNKDLTCSPYGKTFQYETEKIYEMEEEPDICSRGFHFCEYPLDVFSYYEPANSRYCEVEALGDIDCEENGDTKKCTNKIKIGAELNFQDLVKASINFVYEHAKKKKCKGSHLRSDQSVASNSGYQSVASNSGYYSVASNSGCQSVASNSGYQSVASNSGYQSVASNSGYYSVASNSGCQSVASNSGYQSVASNSGDYSVASNSGYQSVASNSGNRSVASNSGNRSVASNSGDYSVASNSGCQSVASNSGCQSVASNSGYQSVASNSGDEGISFSVGIESTAKGKIGTWLVLAEWKQDSNYNWHRTDVQVAQVDGKKIKEDTPYQLINGKFVEVKDD